MIEHHLSLSIRRCLATGMPNRHALLPVLLSAACVVLPHRASAAPVASPEPSANLGEQVLQGQNGELHFTAPEQVDFDSNFLSGSGQKVDLSVFRSGNPLVAGDYRVDIYVNGVWQGRRDLPFRANSGGEVGACIDLKLLEELGVDTEKLSVRDTVSSDCVQVQERMQDGFGVYDSGNLRYDLSIPQAFLRRQARGYVNPELWDRGVNAGFVGYSFNAVDGETRGPFGSHTRNAYLGLNMGLNLGGWQLRQNSSVTWKEGAGSHWQRIDTYAQRGIARVHGMLTIGEAYTNGELFDSIGYRGISLASDDRMLPDSLRGYAPVVRGIAETNARVEIRQNQQLIYSSTVSPGAFVIDDLYPTGYGGDIEVSVIEADGRVRSFKLPFGAVAQMLRPGQARYAFSAGQVRNDSLLDNPWLAQATYQRGIANRLTLYAGALLSRNYSSVLYGVGLSTPAGAISMDVTHARTQLRDGADHQGASLRLSYSSLLASSGTNVTLAAYRYSTQSFYGLQDALAANDAIERGFDAQFSTRQRSQFQLTLNQPLGKRGGALYITGSVRDFYGQPGTNTQYQFGYNNSWRALSFGLSAMRTGNGFGGQHDTQYLLSMSMPLGRSSRPMSISTDIGLSDGGVGGSGLRYGSSRVGVTGSAGDGNNINYGLTLTDTRDADTSAVATLNYRGRYATLDGSYGYSDSFRQLSLSASGNVVAHAGGITFAPYRGDTMVLVQAPNAQGAAVLNAPGLRVDGRGYAVVPYASPYRLNAVTLDPAGMAQDVELESSSQSVAPYAGAISLMRFQTRSGRALLISVVGAAGKALPIGSPVRDEQGQLVGMVGQGGRLYVRTEKAGGRLQVQWGTGPSQQCALDYVVGPAQDAGQLGMTMLESLCR